jgi:hypothetical protein
MRTTHTLYRLPILILLAMLIPACEPADTPVAFNTGVRVWIDQPVNGALLPMGPYPLKAHARDALGGGVQQIVFLINTIPLGTVNTDPTQPLVSAELAWNPSVSGQYRIQARAFGKNGAELSEEVLVCVGTSCAPAAPDTPTTVPTSPRTVIPSPITSLPGVATVTSPRSLQATAIPTQLRNTPTHTFTPIPPPPPPQACTGLPNIASFSVSPTTITRGGSAALSWGAVTNADSVSIDPGIGSVATPGSRSVSPTSTTTYTLLARCGNNTATRQLTLAVQAPPPPMVTSTRTSTPVPPKPPAAPTGLSLKNRACSTPDQVQITWSDNSNNESGFSIYRRVRVGATWGAWALRTNVGANTTQFTDTSGFTSANRLEYYVQASNAGGASTPSNTLTVIECPF